MLKNYLGLSVNKNQIRVKEIVRRLKKEYPRAKTALKFKNPLEMLVATILSAQCTDERVNKVTPNLFLKYHSIKDFADANITEFENDIKSTGFYKAKARNIVNCCKALLENYDGKLPTDIDEFIKLPGVGRKTANVVLGAAFGIASGIVVDTHVKRLVERLGLTNQINPEKIENNLMEIVPKNNWIDFGNILILHGRNVCIARKPKCANCIISDLCPSEKLYIKN